MTQQNALFIVATPIGNLGDMSLRAIEVLRGVDIVAAEDTRHSAKLLQHFDIATPLVSYHDFGGEAQVQRILAKLASGGAVALISDAGTPLISDPGYRLVNTVRAAGFAVVPIPGCCALVAALSASGLPSDRWTFEGFPPAKAMARRSAFEALVADPRTLIFYESTHRIVECLEDMATIFGGDREICIARELTKNFETFLSGALAEVLARLCSDPNQQRGEFVVLVRGYVRPQDESLIAPEDLRVFEVLAAELPLKQAAALAAKITGEKKNRFYQWGVQQLGEA